MARILIVDDDEIIAEIASEVLMRAGHTVTTVDHGDDAIAAVLADEPDLVILDYTLPGRTGRDILRELRTSAYATDMPVVMLTSRHGRVHTGIAEIDGANEYITKPFDPADLLVRVNALLVGSAVPRQATDAARVDVPRG